MAEQIGSMLGGILAIFIAIVLVVALTPVLFQLNFWSGFLFLIIAGAMILGFGIALIKGLAG